MVVKLDKTLDSLLGQIEFANGPLSTEIYTCTKRIDYPDHQDGGLANVNSILWNEFYKRFPNEFNELLAEDGVFMASYVEFLESQRESDLIETLQKKGGIPSKESQLMLMWLERVGMSVDTLMDLAVEFGNNDDPTKPVVVSRYYGRQGVVYKVEHQGVGSSYRTWAEQFLQNPKSLKDRLEPIKNTFGNEHLVLAFNERGNEVYAMYICQNLIPANQ